MHFYFVRDDYHEGYRVGRTDWPGDAFEMLTELELIEFRKWCDRFAIKLEDLTDE